MLKRLNWMFLLLLMALVAFAGCSDDDDPTSPTPTNTFADVAADVSAVLNDNTVTVGGISATDLFDAQNQKVPVYTVIDIRGQTDYDNGHIPGAYRSSLGTLVSDLADGTIPTGKPYVVACYTGQSAGHAKMAMSLLGYEAKTLLFGMSSWSANVTGSKWSEAGSCKDMLSAPETTGNNGNLLDHDYPSLDDDLETRVADVLAAGFKSIGYTADLNNSETYFILNYWSEADYMGTGGSGTTGHIPGAYQFTPYASLDMGAMLKNLPTDKQIIVYCWTGQHSSQVTFALNVMGYDALSLRYGANQLMWSNLTAHKWSDTMVKDYPLEATK